MTAEPFDVAAALARAKTATPGPWTAWRVGTRQFGVETAEGIDVTADCIADDAEFIAHAREDVPALVALLAEARWQRDVYARQEAEAQATIAAVRDWNDARHGGMVVFPELDGILSAASSDALAAQLREAKAEALREYAAAIHPYKGGAFRGLPSIRAEGAKP